MNLHLVFAQKQAQCDGQHQAVNFLIASERHCRSRTNSRLTGMMRVVPLGTASPEVNTRRLRFTSNSSIHRRSSIPYSLPGSLFTSSRRNPAAQSSDNSACSAVLNRCRRIRMQPTAATALSMPRCTETPPARQNCRRTIQGCYSVAPATTDPVDKPENGREPDSISISM
jgi:hypothetical protein